MKKVLSILVIVILLIGITGCDSKNTAKKIDVKIASESNIQIENNDVNFKIKDGTLSNSSATIILENNNGNTIGYGNSYWLEKEQDGKWYSLENTSDRVFETPLFHIEPGKAKEIDINLEYGYGKLTTGKYRIVKDMVIIYEDNNFKDFNIAVEFTID